MQACTVLTNVCPASDFEYKSHRTVNGQILMVSRHTEYRGYSIITDAVEVAGTGHFVTTLAIKSESAVTFNAPITCSPFADASDALGSRLAIARAIVDSMVRS